MKIFLDPGHGAPDPGAVGPTGLTEASVVRKVAKVAAEALSHLGHEPLLSCASEFGIPLEARARIANTLGVDLVVSIHCNAAANPAARGIEAWTTPGQTKADLLADDLLTALSQAFPKELVRRDTSDGDGDKEKRFRVLVDTNAPAVLVELGFISHPETEASMRSPSWVALAGGAIALGINKYLEEAP